MLAALAVAIASAQNPSANAGSSGPKHPAPGTTIVRFAQVDTNVYKGSKPKNDADYRFLQSKGVRSILDLKFLPFWGLPEERQAKKYGITYISVYMNASPLAPSEKHVKHALAVLHDPCLHPIYFHCELGRDRSSLIAALYKMYFQHMSPEQAWQQMEDYGFKNSWTLRGLRNYLSRHPVLVAPLPREHACNTVQ